MAHLTRLVSQGNGNISHFFSIGTFGHGNITNKNRPASRNNHRGGHEFAAFGDINDPAYML